MILVRKELNSTDVTVLDLNNHEAGESVWCEVSLRGSGKLIVGCIYRAPSSPSANNDLICDLMRRAEHISGGKQLLVCGDVNFDSIMWEENQVNRDGYNVAQAENFLEAVNDCHWTAGGGVDSHERYRQPK